MWQAVLDLTKMRAAITRLIGTILLEQNGEWAVQRARYMTLETVTPIGHDDLVKLPPAVARSIRFDPPDPVRRPPLSHHATGHDPTTVQQTLPWRHFRSHRVRS